MIDYLMFHYGTTCVVHIVCSLSVYSATGERSVHSLQKPIIHVASLSNGSIVAVDSWGTVRILEIGHHALQR